MNWGVLLHMLFAMNGFSQSQMMELIQNRRLDPGTAVKAISNQPKKGDQIKLRNIKNLVKLKNSKKNSPILIGGHQVF